MQAQLDEAQKALAERQSSLDATMSDLAKWEASGVKRWMESLQVLPDWRLGSRSFAIIGKQRGSEASPDVEAGPDSSRKIARGSRYFCLFEKFM